MMRLSTLWKVDRSVGADGRSPVAERIVTRWEHDTGSARFFRSSANFVYVFRRAGRRCFLRFADGSERTRAAIGAEVGLVDWLAGVGLDVAAPLRSDTGNLVETVETDLGVFHAVAFRGLEGRQREIEGLDRAGFRAWGAALGRLHATMQGYAGPDLAARGDWRDQLEAARAYLPQDETMVRMEWERIAAALGGLPVSPDTYGLIHFDFELDNLCWRDGAIGMLDFDGCAHYWYVADVAFALRDLFDNGADLGDPSCRAFVEGYRTQYPLGEEALALVPLFSRVARLLNYVSVVRALDLPEGGDYPEWLGGLIRRFAERKGAYEAALARGRG